MANVYPVIMAGGSGTRLWPLSTPALPKQFLRLLTGRSMLEETLRRLDGLQGAASVHPPTVICASRHAAKVKELLPDLAVSVIAEPVGRNTAAAAVVAALHVSKHDPEGCVLLMPADHHITQPNTFARAVETACEAAQQGFLTTIGIHPSRPATGYGYIKLGDDVAAETRRVATFLEKPALDVARRLLAEGGYAWNAGIFVFGAETFLAEAAKLAPDVVESARRAFARGSLDAAETLQLDHAAFEQIPAVSVDVAIMEKTERAAVVGPIEMGWSDIGSWRSLHDALASKAPRSATATAAHTSSETHKDNVTLIDSPRSVARSDGPSVVMLGVADVMVIATEGQILVVDAAHADGIRERSVRGALGEKQPA